jgi:hypothetical protein
MTTHYEKAPPDIPSVLRRLNSVLTYAEIGAEAGVDGDSIGRYIDGSRRRIGLETAWRIMRLYYRQKRKIRG